MTEVKLPKNYDSIEVLHTWLRENFEQEHDSRWRIIAYPGRGYLIEFVEDHDAMMFSLKWKHD
jgi:hypothetical protein